MEAHVVHKNNLGKSEKSFSCSWMGRGFILRRNRPRQTDPVWEEPGSVSGKQIRQWLGTTATLKMDPVWEEPGSVSGKQIRRWLGTTATSKTAALSLDSVLAFGSAPPTPRLGLGRRRRCLG